MLVKMHQYLPPALQEVADIVVSFRHQMEGFPNDLLLHVLRLRHMGHSSTQPWKRGFGVWFMHQPPRYTTAADAPSFHFNICWLVVH